RYVYGGLREWPENLLASLCAQNAPQGYATPWSDAMFDIAVDVAGCRPAGRYVAARGPTAVLSGKRAWHACRRHKYCPWCHYRRITDGWAGLPGLYDQVMHFAADPAVPITLVRGWAWADPKTASSLREKLYLKLKRTVKPDAFWLLCRPNLH